jgi:hypothetical protein
MSIRFMNVPCVELRAVAFVEDQDDPGLPHEAKAFADAAASPLGCGFISARLGLEVPVVEAIRVLELLGDQQPHGAHQLDPGVVIVLAAVERSLADVLCLCNICMPSKEPR